MEDWLKFCAVMFSLFILCIVLVIGITIGIGIMFFGMDLFN